MDHLKTVLSEAVGKVCQQLLAYNTALKYECLLAVTVDSVTSLVFNLQGYAGTPATELTAWTRRPQTESFSVKTSIEETLMEVCFAKVAEVSVIKLEGLLTVVLDNTDVIIANIDKILFAPETETKKETKEVAVSKEEQEAMKESEVYVSVEPVKLQESDIAVINPSVTMMKEAETAIEDQSDVNQPDDLNPQDVIMVVMGSDQPGEEGTTATVVTALNQAAIEGDSGKWTSLLATDWEEEHAGTDLLMADRTDSIQAAATLSELAMAAEQFQTQQLVSQYPDQPKLKRTVSCSVCDATYNNNRSLMHHMSQVHDIKPVLGSIKCQHCDKTFLTKKTMRHHNCMNRCDQCDFVGKTKKLLKGHIFRVHQLPQPNPDNTITCNVCGQLFRNYTKLRDHIQFHSVDTLSNIVLRKVMDMDNQRLKGACSCVLCDKTFDHSWHMKQHMAVNHALQGPCTAFHIIKQSPIWNNPARWCTLIHGKVKPLSKLALAIVAKPCTRTASEYKCLLCSKSRMSPFYILRHMERHLGQLKKGNRDGSFRKTYSCMICFSKFASEKTLEMHRKYVHGMKFVDVKRRLHCDICGTVFQNIGNLDRHMSLHRFRSTHGEKWKTIRPHQCKQCNRTFASENAMAKHIVELHPQEEERSEFEDISEDVTVTVKVENTSSSAGTSVHTVKHGLEIEHEGDQGLTIVTLDPDKVMQDCPVCNKQFADKTQILRHLKTHRFGKGTVRKYRCDNCKSSFLYESSLKKHRRGCLRREIDVKHSEFFCDICELYLISEVSLKRHRKRCHDPEFDPEEEVSNLGSQCDFCGAKLSSRQALIKHKRYWHKNKGWKKPVKTPSKKLICDECGARMHNSANLRRHKQRWHDPTNPAKTSKQHVCGYCGEMFFNVTSFQAHLHEIHSLDKEKPEYVLKITETASKQTDQLETVNEDMEGLAVVKQEVMNDNSGEESENIVEVLPQIELVPIDEQESQDIRSSLDLVEKPTAKKKIREDSLTQTPIAADENVTGDKKKLEDETPRRLSKRTPKATFKVLEGDGSSRKRNIEDSLECETCGMVMSSLNFLKRHMEKVHANKNQDNTQGKVIPKRKMDQPNLKCSECDMTCSSKANLERHVTRWHGNQPAKRMKKEK